MWYRTQASPGNKCTELLVHMCIASNTFRIVTSTFPRPTGPAVPSDQTCPSHQRPQCAKSITRACSSFHSFRTRSKPATILMGLRLEWLLRLPSIDVFVLQGNRCFQPFLGRKLTKCYRRVSFSSASTAISWTDAIHSAAAAIASMRVSPFVWIRIAHTDPT
jgi:hypothetical protein